MLLFLKSTTRTAHEEHNNYGQDYRRDEAALCTSLTVWRKSLLFSCNGFTVIGAGGDLVYRVDNYTGHRRQVVLMDGSGKPILTICRRKKLRLVDDWLVYEGEGEADDSSPTKGPICCMRKHINILQPNLKTLAHIYSRRSQKKWTYIIEGSYSNRSCRVIDGPTRSVVAEIKKKEATRGGISFGLEVFQLVVGPGFDPGLAMAIVLLLDQMFS